MVQWNWPLRTLRLGLWETPVEFLDVPVYLAGLFTAVSGFGYIVDGIRQLHAGGHGDPKPKHELLK